MSEADQGGDKNKSDKDEASKRKGKNAKKKSEKQLEQERIEQSRRVAELIWSIAHPVRRRILRAVGRKRKPRSPIQIAKQLKIPLSMVSYHTTVLRQFGAVELAAERPARGAMEHFYDSAIEDAKAIEALLEETREADEEDSQPPA
jgi:DNA-binding transcriptional ArsR family regulator